MKKLAVIITTFVLTLASLQSQASLINLSTDQASYNSGDTVLLDISVTNINPAAAELGFNVNFDSLALTFDSFDFSMDVLSSAFFPMADLSFFDDNIIEVFVLWFDSADLPGTSFSLGQVSFTAVQAFSGSFEVSDTYLADVTGADVELTAIDVPAPASSLLLMLTCLLIGLMNKRVNIRKK
ncbi:MAG: hypothetical protein ABJH28_04770 [Paraglaciecola sp.]|uniref:hypothetical protein n=1 Tax=Paraglaciecola sp. TaxID=1920173 RepID=UPI0032674027